MRQFVSDVVDKDAEVGGLAWVEETISIIVVQHGAAPILQRVAIDGNVEVEITRHLAVDGDFDIEPDTLIGWRIF